jgi:hypothetical protein
MSARTSEAVDGGRGAGAGPPVVASAPVKTGRKKRMKEPHIEGVATHDDPESCAGVREGVGEASTWAHVG